ncbi:hypothetical protein SK128_000899, partial [Halocaridina rubra]
MGLMLNQLALWSSQSIRKPPSTYSQGKRSRTPSEHLKSQILQNPILYMQSPTYDG